MEWSAEQDNALKEVASWLVRADRPIFRLFGYAGTGKTTLARHFAADCEGRVVFTAFTGKAAHVLQQKGCEGASTIHSLIYLPKDKSKARLQQLEEELEQARREQEADPIDGRLQHLSFLEREVELERQNLARPAFQLNLDSSIRDATLVIVDECSMVDGRIGEDLLSFDVPILVLGDPAQLPPIGGGGFFTEHKPDIMLEQIHRQAADNPIIRLATDTRLQRPLGMGEYGDSLVCSRADLHGMTELLKADQVLVGKNATRHTINGLLREALGFPSSGGPCVQDKLVCLRNNHDLGLLNGSLWEVHDTGELEEDKIMLEIASLDRPDCASFAVEAHSQPFQGQSIQLDWWEKKEAEEFDYGYAMTVHKAQGSQWDNVLLVDESRVFRNDKWRWLYTGITRAAENITIVRD